MALFLALAAVAFHWIPINHDLSLKTNKIGWPAYVVLACMIIYVGFYSSGMGNTAWLSSEFFPMEVRAYGYAPIVLIIHSPSKSVIVQ
jgi:SP family myo-inositol transporter-like MFS transporter 13